MGFRCSKGDLGQIKKRPVGASRAGTLGADGISCLETWGQAFVGGLSHPQGSLEDEQKDPGTPGRSPGSASFVRIS